MLASHVVACGFLVALLALETKSAPRPRHKVPVWQDPSRDTAALGRELAELLAEAFSGPVSRGGGGKPDSGRQRQQQHRSKGASSSSSSTSRAMWDLRTDAKQARSGWGRLGHSEHHQGGGGGGGGSRRPKGSKKGLTKGCFGLKLDRIGTMSGLGC